MNFLKKIAPKDPLVDMLTGSKSRTKKRSKGVKKLTAAQRRKQATAMKRVKTKAFREGLKAAKRGKRY